MVRSSAPLPSSPHRMDIPGKRQAITPVILMVAIVCMAWYWVLLLRPAGIGNPVAFGLFLLAEIIAAVQLLGAWITIILGPPTEPRLDVIAARKALERNPRLAGTVAVFVPVCGEPLELIAETLVAARDIAFPHETYVLDDGTSDDVQALADRLRIGYLRRSGNVGWKAGNINHALENVECEYVAIFDSDHVAKPEFLIETLPWLLADRELAFVQTPQYMMNRDGFVSGGIAESQEVFYHHIKSAKSRFNAAFCVGTNVLFRTAALQELGGMYDKSHCEDIWTSIFLHEAGWKSVFLPTVLAHGQAPETVETFLRQQFRWASGAYEVLLKKNPLLIRAFTLDQKLQYLHTALFFTTGFAVAIFYVLPLLYVYFGWRAMDVSGGIAGWAIHFVPFFLMMLFSTAHLRGGWPKWRTYVVALSSFTAHIGACITVLTGIRFRWKASGAVRSNIDYVKPVMVHLLLLLLSVGAIPILLMTERSAGMGFTTALWLLFNSVTLFSLCKRAIPSRAERRAPVAATGYEFTAASPA